LNNIQDLEDAEQNKTSDKKQKAKGSRWWDRRRKLKKQKGEGGKAYGNARGAKRGQRGGKHDAVFVREQPRIDPNALDEGLYVLVQTGKCRRLVLTEIYGNKPPCEFLIFKLLCH
jgi:hypothetical protein